MAGSNLMAAGSVAPKVLYSGQLPDTADHSLYAPAAGNSAMIKHGVACNVSTAAVTLNMSIVPSGGTADGTHRIISGYSLAAGDSLPLKDLLEDCCLGPGDSIHAQAGVAAAIDIVLTGTEHT